MWSQVNEVHASLEAIVGALDPASVPLVEAADAWSAFDAVERLAAAGKTLLAGRVDESREWRRLGYRSAAEFMAARSGAAVGEARRSLETSANLEVAPLTEDALRRGRLSARQADEVAAAAVVDPAAESRLLEGAARQTLSQLRDECAAVRAAADPDPEATYRRVHARRSLREYRDAEGAWNLCARGPADAGAQWRAAIEPIIDELFRARRASGEHEPREAYAFDALIELARRARGEAPEEGRRRNPTYLALLRVDLEALVRGAVEGEERCEITGIGPVPVRVARELLGDAVLKLVVTKGVDVANVTHLGRGPTAAQRVALLWTSPTCSVEGCNGVRVQIDHRIPWATTRHTRLDESDPLCKPHHDRKTHEGWALVEGTGKRPFVPPDDPRHPSRPRGDPTPGRSPPCAA